MDIDPMNTVEERDEPPAKPTAPAAHLNTWVAITVALLATFTGICKVKDDNIVQAMEEAQADKLDHWSFYQARNIREEVAKSTLAELRLALAGAAADRRAATEETIRSYEALAAEEAARKDSLRAQARQDQATYDALNYRDDQFDLSDAMVALAISLLALTALTRKRWLFWVGMVPTALGILMGLAGLFQWKIHPGTIVKWLS